MTVICRHDKQLQKKNSESFKVGVGYACNKGGDQGEKHISANPIEVGVEIGVGVRPNDTVTAAV